MTIISLCDIFVIIIIILSIGFIIKLVATNLARLALILYMLLLQAGDIETNPGPTTREYLYRPQIHMP